MPGHRRFASNTEGKPAGLGTHMSPSVTALHTTNVCGGALKAQTADGIMPVSNVVVSTKRTPALLKSTSGVVKQAAKGLLRAASVLKVSPSKLPTLVMRNRLEMLLEGYAAKRCVIYGFTQGFKLGDRGLT